ncbi:camphor resistance protein CrcB [Cohaesibacter marisflavi]|uniref:Fluoride-specific ion channel FluC n=1 Tax=Cohaesibacter marisflavi TaxID=655353 RepID=A0A1I5G7B2_9HYPH|nr:fluoride efflux transporter CrcB [Cohaesibacter marisflavi]SFO31874.1 camphor resistance protein CrcB [Cohaesibacter marisflavi]
MNQFIFVAIGGACGASLRHLVGLAALRSFGSGLPYGTMICNIVGSFFMGLLIHFLAVRFSASTEIRLLLTTGLLGGFTTFSTFSLDIVTMTERGQSGLALFYIAISLAGGIVALFVGLSAARALV